MKRQIAEGLRLGTLHPLAADLDAVHEEADAKRREIKGGGKFSPSYKREQSDAIDAEADALIERVKAEHRKTSMRPLDTEEGRLRATLRDAANDQAAQFREARASRFASLMGNARGADDIDRIWADAMLTNDADAISAAASAGLKRHADLTAEKKAIPVQHAALQAHFLTFETAVDEWTRANPTPARRLAMIERERANIEMRIEETAAFVARLYGVGARSRVASHFHEGRGFDRRATRSEAIDVPTSERMLAGLNRTSVRR